MYDKPRTLMSEPTSTRQDVFTTRQQALRTLQRFVVGKGTEDIFDAVAFASTLQFRPGVSKIFIVVPCSSCDPGNMTVMLAIIYIGRFLLPGWKNPTSYKSHYYG